MNLLALDTSTQQLCLALAAQGRMAVLEEAAGAGTSARLLPAAESLLRGQSLGWSDLDGLVYGQGPGAFTGLRAACSTVQGLALGLDIPVLAVCSLMVVAECARLTELADAPSCTVRVAVDARMGEVYDAAFEWNGQAWRTLRAPVVRSPGQALAQWLADAQDAAAALPVRRAAASALAGSGLSLMDRPLLERAAADGTRLVPSAGVEARALGACALRCWQQQPARLDAALAMPLYVRNEVALTSEQRLQRARGLEP